MKINEHRERSRRERVQLRASACYLKWSLSKWSSPTPAWVQYIYKMVLQIEKPPFKYVDNPSPTGTIQPRVWHTISHSMTIICIREIAVTLWQVLQLQYRHSNIAALSLSLSLSPRNNVTKIIFHIISYEAAFSKTPRHTPSLRATRLQTSQRLGLASLSLKNRSSIRSHHHNNNNLIQSEYKPSAAVPSPRPGSKRRPGQYNNRTIQLI